MAIALPLIIELFHSLDRAVQWLSGGSTPSPQARDGRDSEPSQGSDRSRGSQRLCLPSQAPTIETKQWGGPLRLHPDRRVYRALTIQH
jgi:hypothetical protein